MKKVSMFLMLCASLFIVGFSGCGSKESTVIEAPAEDTDTSAMQGIDDDEYNNAMTESLESQE